MAALKKIFYFLVPAALLAFIFFQNIAPLLKQTSSIVPKAQASAAVAAKPAENADEPFDLKQVKDGVYYAYKADFSCVNPRTPDAAPVPSHFDSYGVQSGKICRLGNSCDESFGCSGQLPPGMKFAKDRRSLVMNGRLFRLQKSSYPPSCAMPSCSPPPENCHYSVAAPLDERGCALGCGSMSCKAAADPCPALECAVPPANCAYDGMGSRDSNNCPISCGKIICDIVGEETSCPALECTAPPENCRYDRNFKKDARGCKTSCGNLTCDRRTTEAPVCKEVECASPPPGCNYEGAVPRDENGCITSCGSLACAKSQPEKCKLPQCEPPPPNCRYDGNSPLDFEGCSSGCGNLICSEVKPQLLKTK